MSIDTTARQVQQKLNRLSMHVLGLLLTKCGRSPPIDTAAGLFRWQVLHAMAPEFDRDRLNDAASFEAIATLGNGRWLHEDRPQ